MSKQRRSSGVSAPQQAPDATAAAESGLDVLGNEAKVEALRMIDKLLRAADPRVQQVMVSLAGGVDTVLVARSDGVLAADVRPLVRLNVQVIVEQNGRRESGYAGGGGRYSYADLLSGGKPEAWAREALRQALVNLDAIDAPAGVMPVVLGSGWPGVLLHEAVGHGLEFCGRAQVPEEGAELIHGFQREHGGEQASLGERFLSGRDVAVLLHGLMY